MSDALHQQARRATARVRLARNLGFVVAGIAAVVVAIFVWQSAAFGLFAAAPEKVVAIPEKATVITASSSTFSGLDDAQKPFEVNADNAIQDQGNNDLVHLDGVHAKFYRIADPQADITSDKANYNVKTKALDLLGQVVFDEPGHYKARLQSAAVSLDDKAMTSDKPVTVDIPGGKVEADSMSVASGGTHILFRGHVHAKFTNEFATTTADGEGG